MKKETTVNLGTAADVKKSLDQKGLTVEAVTEKAVKLVMDVQKLAENLESLIESVPPEVLAISEFSCIFCVNLGGTAVTQALIGDPLNLVKNATGALDVISKKLTRSLGETNESSCEDSQPHDCKDDNQ